MVRRRAKVEVGSIRSARRGIQGMVVVIGRGEVGEMVVVMVNGRGVMGMAVRMGDIRVVGGQRMGGMGIVRMGGGEGGGRVRGTEVGAGGW
jgi:hypothetical protein